MSNEEAGGNVRDLSKEELLECLELFWLYGDALDIISMFYDENAPQISDDGLVEAECIAREAQSLFLIKITRLRNLIGEMP